MRIVNHPFHTPSDFQDGESCPLITSSAWDAGRSFLDVAFDLIALERLA